jgi:hypothetical protein
MGAPTRRLYCDQGADSTSCNRLIITLSTVIEGTSSILSILSRHLELTIGKWAGLSGLSKIELFSFSDDGLHSSSKVPSSSILSAKVVADHDSARMALRPSSYKVAVWVVDVLAAETLSLHSSSKVSSSRVLSVEIVADHDSARMALRSSSYKVAV